LPEVDLGSATPAALEQQKTRRHLELPSDPTSRLVMEIACKLPLKSIMNEQLIGGSVKNEVEMNPTKTVLDATCLVRHRFNYAVVRPKVQVENKGETKSFFLEEVSSTIPKKMKKIGEACLGKTVTNGCQHLDKKVGPERNVLNGFIWEVVFLMCQFSLLMMEFFRSSLQLEIPTWVKKTGNLVVCHFIAEFKCKHEKDINENKRAVLYLYCLPVLTLIFFYEGIDFYTSITCPRFEDLNADLKAPLRCQTRQVTGSIVLVAGSTSIPKIQKFLNDFFNRKRLSTSINPDKAIAYEVAVQEAILSGDKSDSVKDLLLLDVTPLPLGIKTDGGVMTVFTKHNTIIPIPPTLTTTWEYEDEKAMTKDNNLLGKFELIGISPAPYGILQNEVTLTLKYNTEDEKQRDKVPPKNSLEFYAFSMRATTEDEKLQGKINDEDEQKILDKYDETIKTPSVHNGSIPEGKTGRYEEFLAEIIGFPISEWKAGDCIHYRPLVNCNDDDDDDDDDNDD
ncbi:hypothetical protein A6R68_00453, partial [Neotoma lepida]